MHDLRSRSSSHSFNLGFQKFKLSWRNFFIVQRNRFYSYCNEWTKCENAKSLNVKLHHKTLKKFDAKMNEVSARFWQIVLGEARLLNRRTFTVVSGEPRFTHTASSRTLTVSAAVFTVTQITWKNNICKWGRNCKIFRNIFVPLHLQNENYFSASTYS